jgi:hypothetical protein
VGSLSLRPGDSLTIPKMALSVGFIRFVSSPDATQATGLPTLAPVGLTPTEHASLCWTYWLAKTLAVGSGTGAVAPRNLRSPGSSSRHITRSVRISRTTRSCTLHDKGYEAYRVGAAAQEGG